MPHSFPGRSKQPPWHGMIHAFDTWNIQLQLFDTQKIPAIFPLFGRIASGVHYLLYCCRPTIADLATIPNRQILPKNGPKVGVEIAY